MFYYFSSVPAGDITLDLQSLL